MAHLDKNGALKEIEQVLSEDSPARLDVGKSTRQDVLRRIGSPWHTGYFERREEEFWDYRIKDSGGYPSGLHVIFNKDGVVTQTLIICEHPPGDAHGGGHGGH